MRAGVATAEEVNYRQPECRRRCSHARAPTWKPQQGRRDTGSNVIQKRSGGALQWVSGVRAGGKEGGVETFSEVDFPRPNFFPA